MTDAKVEAKPAAPKAAATPVTAAEKAEKKLAKAKAKKSTVRAVHLSALQHDLQLRLLYRVVWEIFHSY